MPQKMLPISFRKLINAGTSGYLDYVIPDSGTISKVVAYFPQGQTFDLKVWPVIIQKGTEAPTDIVLAAPGTEKWLYGDNISLQFDCARPVDAHDVIRIFYKNDDAANDLNLSVDVTIEYYVGKAWVM